MSKKVVNILNTKPTPNLKKIIHSAHNKHSYTLAISKKSHIRISVCYLIMFVAYSGENYDFHTIRPYNFSQLRRYIPFSKITQYQKY